ncbi:uncharacterized protein LOC143281566 [Babylonia areolata]|uniref:uncharacterized protein LOC143281566 n=1 Tax=Babylonia areolata TaxID=304850 RepID=UPI003FCF8CFB
MDPFSKRLRKQRERSSLHARQLNKNATALLHRQLHVLDRRQQQNARVLRRSRQAILQELTDAEEPEHEGLHRRREDLDHHHHHQQQHHEQQHHQHHHHQQHHHHHHHRPAKASSVLQTSPLSSSLNLHLQAVPHHADSSSKFTTCSPRSSSGFLNLDLPMSLPRGHHHHHGGDTHQACRFRALSALTPCPYFPCRRPHSYHRLKVSDVPDVIPVGTGEWDRVQDGSSSHRSIDSLSTTDDPPPSTSGTGGKGGGCSPPRGSFLTGGLRSPRTSINERVRGLKQLAREQRARNEQKRPRAWAVNYGDPVSRRLLRKPVVAVSDQQLAT